MMSPTTIREKGGSSRAASCAPSSAAEYRSSEAGISSGETCRSRICMSRSPASGVTQSRDPYVGVLLMAPSSLRRRPRPARGREHISEVVTEADLGQVLRVVRDVVGLDGGAHRR